MYYNTISENLRNVLNVLMNADELADFRLVGGTSLSLQLGHRISVDIDMFTDVQYGSIDFKAIDKFIEARFPYHSHFAGLDPALGKSYTVGENELDSVKLDLYYTDTFIQPALIIDSIRLATIDDIAAMKIDVIQRIGRKKDFWDLHKLLDDYSISSMLNLHKERYSYSHDEELIIHNLTQFELADDDFDPICLHGKHWEFIKDDIQVIIKRYIDE